MRKKYKKRIDDLFFLYPVIDKEREIYIIGYLNALYHDNRISINELIYYSEKIEKRKEGRVKYV